MIKCPCASTEGNARVYSFVTLNPNQSDKQNKARDDTR